MTGRLVGVVGPSGVGKDSLMRALAQVSPEFSLVRRVITRAPELGGEDFHAVDLEEFETRRRSGMFCIDWQAHGLSYGIPIKVRRNIQAGQQMLVNLSRNVLSQTASVFPDFFVLSITARPEILAKRLKGRARETPEEISRRLSRSAASIPTGIPFATISNDGSLQDALKASVAALQMVKS